MEAADFINKLLQRKPANRLGLNGPNEVKNHQWLRDVDWQALISKEYPAPFIPEPRPPLTDTNMDKNPESKEAMVESMLLLRRNSIQKLFNGYEYDIEQQHHAMLQEQRKRKMQSREVVVKHANASSISSNNAAGLNAQG